MTPTNRNKPLPGVLNGIKIIIASGAVAGAVGIWSLLAGKALDNTNIQVQDQGNIDLADLPTLIPLAAVQNSVINSVADQSSTGLRSVVIPTQGAVIQAPVVQTVIIAAPSTGGGGTRPAARTRSSRKR
jgi:hypothetical protein